MKINQKRRNLGTIGLEVVLVLASAFFLSLAFPSFCSKNGWPVFALFALVPLFYVIRNTTWKCVWFYGFLFVFVFYWIFNYWLSSLHPLANILVQIIKGTEMIALFLVLTLPRLGLQVIRTEQLPMLSSVGKFLFRLPSSPESGF